MADLFTAKSLPAEARRSALRRWLTGPPCHLRVIAEEVWAEHSTIDFVAAADNGTPVAVVVAPPGPERELAARTVARGIGAARWLDAHLPNWLKIQPTLPVTPGAPTRAWVLCGPLDPPTRSAALALGPRLEIGRLHELGSAHSEGLYIEWGPAAPSEPSPFAASQPEPVPTEPARREPAPREPWQVPLRSGIALSEFDLGPEELAEFDEPD